MRKYNIIDFGGVGDGISDDAQAIQCAIDECHSQGGGTVYFPEGKTYMSGPFRLKSFVQLWVSKGATLLANPDESVYTESAFRENQGEGTIWIGGKDIDQISITGGGIIDGNGISFMGREYKDAYELKPFDTVDPRPHILTLINGRNIDVCHITFKNAAYWGLHFIGCQNILINNIFLFNSLKIRNGDGIDIDHSRNVIISNCHIESGDDCICFKNRREYAEFGPCSDIIVKGCTLTSTSCAIKFGSENVDEIKNVVINQCIIKNSNRGIGIQNRDEGSVTNVMISDIILDCRLFSDVWWGKAEPIYVTAFPRDNKADKDGGLRFPRGAKEGRVGEVSNITFRNIQCLSENGIFVAASEPSKVSNIFFSNVHLHINKMTDYPGGLYDCRPCAGNEMVMDDTFGFYLMNVSRISIKDCELTWGDNRPTYFNNGMKSINSSELRISNYNYSPADELNPSITPTNQITS